MCCLKHQTVAFCDGSLSRLTAAFHSQTMLSPGLCTQPSRLCSTPRPYIRLVGESQATEMQRGDNEGRGGGTRQRLSGNSLPRSCQEPWEQLATPPQHTLNLLLSPKRPTRQPPSPLPALPSDTIQVGATPLGPSRTARWHCRQHREPEPHPRAPQGLRLILACFTNQILSRAKLSSPNSWPRDSHQTSDVPEHRKEAVMGTASPLFHPLSH